MTQTVSIDEAQDKLPDLLAQALAGNEVIITDHGTPVARLVPVVAHTKKKRVAGINRGTVSTSEDFDEPLSDEFWLGQQRKTKPRNKGLVKLLLSCPVKDWLQPLDHTETTEDINLPKLG